MIDICYYNDQIREETDGAYDYIERAIDYKKSHPEWADMYSKMAATELEHAATLVKIFEEDYKANKTNDPIYEQIHAMILKIYSDGTSRVKRKQSLYSSK